MKNCYVERDFRSIADLCLGREMGFTDNVMIITRINVPEKWRGLGIGSRLLTQILSDADRDGITLGLEVQPTGGLNLEQLEAWYSRHGFKYGNLGLMFRNPVKG